MNMKKFWNWIKSTFKRFGKWIYKITRTKLVKIVPKWPEPFDLPDVIYGKSTRFGLANNYINITKKNRIFFDIDNDKEMDYINPQKDFQAEVENQLHYSGDEIKLQRQSIEMELFNLSSGVHLFRVDLVEYDYMPSADDYSEHHVKAIYRINVIEK